MAWPQLSSFGASLRKFTSQDNDQGLVLLIGRLHTINIDEAVKFGFVEASEPKRSEIISGLPPGGYAGEKMMVSPLPSIRLSQLVKFAPGFDLSMVDDIDPPVVRPVLQSATVVLPKAEKKERISDAGVKIGRARKDFYSRRVTAEDVSGMTEAEKKKFISKLALWAYSPSQAREDGVEYGVAEFIQSARLNMPDFSALKSGSIGSALKIGNDEAGSFIGFCNAIADKLNSELKSKKDLALALIDLHEDPAFMAYVKHINSRSYISRDFKKVMKFCDLFEFKPNQKPDGSFYIYRFSDGLKVIESPQTAREISDNEYALRSNQYHWDKLCRVRKEKTKGEDGAPVRPDRPHLADLKNSWLRKDADITPQDLISVFGFRGVEFGEWLPQDERQIVLNEAYAACCALAEVTGLPESMISLNGTLAIAFGSRGKGRAMAHYEPDLEVFNLTRMNGAGSMAHEWAHALDYFLSKKKESTIESATSSDRMPVTEDEITIALARIKDMFAAKDPAAHSKSFGAAMQIVRSEIEWSKQPELAMSELQDSISKRIEYAVTWIIKWGRDNAASSSEMNRVLRGELMDIYGLEVAKDEDLPQINYRSIKSFAFTLEAIARMSVEDRPDLVYSGYDMMERNESRIISALKATGFVNDENLHKKKNAKNFRGLVCNAMLDLMKFRLYVRKPESLIAAANRKSRFTVDAELLDSSKSKKYYSTSKELFARSFESFVFDQMKAMDTPCDYLVHSVEEDKFSDKTKYIGNPYPEGDERKKINIAMSRLMEIVREYASPSSINAPRVQP